MPNEPQETNQAISHKFRLLMLTTLIISGCSMCYELIISAVSTYLLGNSTLQYSITIGLYMCSLGLGSWLSKYISDRLYHALIYIEFSIGIIGGLSATILFLANLYIPAYDIVMYLTIIIIGTLAGAEIPVLTRIIESEEPNLKVTLSSIFSFDYIGGLIGAIAFPLLLLPKLGYLSTAFLCGLMNTVAAMLILWKYASSIRKVRILKIISIALALLMLSGALFSKRLSAFIEDGLYRDMIVLSEQTPYQKIVMTKHRDDTRLFIDGNCQFSTKDEYRYHEALVHIPMSRAAKHDHILVLGGGDGMAVREILKYNIQSVDLVDLDKEIIQISSTNQNITKINKDSLKSSKLTIYNMDAGKYLENNTKKYDVIIVDLPDPNNDALAKLYSNIFYRLCKNSLTQDGILVVQSTSPYYAKDAFWCINKTIESEQFYVKPYHLQVPAFGDWGFNMASLKPLDDEYHLTVDTKYLSDELIPGLFKFGKDEIASSVEINHLTHPVLMDYYNTAVEKLK